MAETALYRKYRPQNFDEVIGQDQVTEVLKASLKKGTFSHAHLFSGSRGLGKTSIARIFARELGVSENDTYEIDAASNRGIDDIRELKEAVRTMPYESSYKVYIIDEVHMLTNQAFNALLKTLEEPPSHVIFILATTELHKLPDTIISRCEVHRFEQPSLETLSEVVEDVAKKEGYALEGGAGELIALVAEGSFRDALGTLQKVLNVADDKKVTLEEVEQVTRAPKSSAIIEIVEGISSGNIENALSNIDTAADSDTEMRLLFRQLVQYVRFVLLLRHSSNKEIVSESVPKNIYDRLEKIAGDKESKLNSRALSNLLSLERIVKSTSVPAAALELAVLEASNSNVL